MIAPLFLTINNLIHDFASAIWVASIVAVYFLGRKRIGMEKQVSLVLLDLARLFRNILVSSIVVIFLTGIGRTIAYNYFLKQTAVHTYAVLGKHIILIFLAVLSFVYVRNIIGKWQNEIEKST